MSFFSDLASDFSKQIDNVKSEFQNALNSAVKSNSVAKASNAFPWASKDSPFFPSQDVKPENWNQLYPYRLVVWDSVKKSIVGASSAVKTVSKQKADGTKELSFEPIGKAWIFNLPITPQQLSITDQYAINTTATLLGVIEEHNGVKFKTITASGSMGVWPFRESITNPTAGTHGPSVLESVFGGTIEAAKSVATSLARTINTATSNHPAKKPTTKKPENSQAGLASTGYYHAVALSSFLEQYAEAKKNPKNKGYRLVFDIPKQNQSFVVTPIQFVWNQNVAKAMEVQYAFQLKAWRRIDINSPVSPVIPQPDTLTPGVLQRVLNTISEARRLTSSALNLIGAVRSDIERPLDVLRQLSLFIKELTGVAITAADLPFQIQRDYKSAINDILVSFNTSDLSTTDSSNNAIVSAIKNLQKSSTQREGLSIDAVGAGQLGTKASNSQSIDPSHNVFSKPEANFDLINLVPVSSMKLNNAQQRKVDESIEMVKDLTVDDIKTFRNVILTLAQQLANNFGAANSFVSQIYGLPTPTQRITPMTVDDFEILKSLYDVMQSCDTLTATTQIDDLNKQNNMEYVAGLASDSDIPFNITDAKILVPVPFGLTIEGIASRYLKDPQRWLEIVTLNNLRTPYIDEDGFVYTLLSNATGRQITVSSSVNLFLGQRVLIQSSTQTPTTRRILNIDKLSETSYLLTLDGEPNLDNFKVVDGAYLHAYLPGTTNSQQKIFIPSDLPISNDPNIITPAVASVDPLSGMSKVDWLLTDDGDVAVNNFGDFRFSYGITNLIQALKIKLGSQKGKILLHPEFGLGITPGMINGDLDVSEVYRSINQLISEDPRFQGVSNLQVSLLGPTLTINMSVALAGNNGVYPVTFQMNV